MALIKTHCDLCGGIEYAELHQGDLDDAALSAADYYSSSRSVAGHYPIVRCKNVVWYAHPCGMMT
jgi:hypothetical protein